MIERVYNVLFLCTGNSARSIIAECLLNRRGSDRFRAFSAGSHPRHVVHSLALALLKDMGFETAGLRSKSWEEFAAPGAPAMDFVITVCDDTAGETCPVWPGAPLIAHWGIDDPAAVTGSEDQRQAAFRRAFTELDGRIEALVSLPVDSLGRREIQERLDAIGRGGSAGRPG